MAGFKGADGKEYVLTLSVGRLMRFEERTGKKILRQLFGSISAISKKSEEEVESTMMAGLGEIFSSLTDAAALLYACALTRGEAKEVPFDDFCENVLSGSAVKEAAQSIFAALSEELGVPVAEAAALTGADGSDPKKAGG